MTNIIQKMLGMHGHNVETAASGREGVAKFENGCFDLVITDICMPEINGNGVVQYIRDSDKNIYQLSLYQELPCVLKIMFLILLLKNPFL